jgi:hypothetical protein
MALTPMTDLRRCRWKRQNMLPVVLRMAQWQRRGRGWLGRLLYKRAVWQRQVQVQVQVLAQQHQQQ